MLVTVLIINKSFMRTFLVHINNSRSRFNWPTITNKIRNRLTSIIANGRITWITGTDRFRSIKYFDELANTVDVTDIKDIIVKNRFTNYYYALFLGNVSKDFIINNMKKVRIKRSCKIFSVDFNPIDANDILDIHKYLMKRT